MSLLDLVEFIGIGIGVGLLSSLFGLGGGVVIVPLLPLIIVIEPLQVVWISLSCICFIVSMNLISYGRQGLVDWKTILRLTPIALVGAYLASIFSMHVSGTSLRIVSGALLVYLAIQSIRPYQKSAPSPALDKLVYLFALMGGFGSGLTGIGTGAFLTPTLLKIGKLKANMVAPTMNGVLLATTGVSIFSYMINRPEDFRTLTTTHWTAAGVISVSSFLCAIWGRKLQMKLSDHLRRKILGVLLVVFALIVFGQVLSSYRG